MRYSFLLSLSLISITAPAMEKEENNIITGKLAIMTVPYYAAGFEWPSSSLENEPQFKLQDHDILVDVRTFSQESSDWQAHGHPKLTKNERFPKTLPYSMLKGRKENDIISLRMYGKIFILNLRQQEYNHVQFEVILESAKKQFLNDPSFLCAGENRLLAKGIIVKNGPSNYTHGPNGFKDE